jgi:lysozyme
MSTEESTMADLARVYEQLKIDEGIIYEVYKDHLGYLTCGVGHLIVQGDEEYGKPVGTSVTKERVEELFIADCLVTMQECDALFGEENFKSFPDEVREILINMMFNLGRTRLSKFKKMIAALNEKDWVTAASEGRDSLWYRQVTNRAERLMSRLEAV